MTSITPWMRLASWWRRWSRWEFWPRGLFYPPVALYVLWLGLRHRSLTLFTAANPGLPGGGFVGESKGDILRGLDDGTGTVPATLLLPAAWPADQRLAAALGFLGARGLSLPVVIKPDVGERGEGVEIIRTREALKRRLREDAGDLLLQEYVSGPEFGVFYYRAPGAACGGIFSITVKQLPEVRGDGHSTVAQLAYRDPATRAQAARLLAARPDPDRVPALGERIALGDIGNHCRGARFFDGGHLATAALVATLDRIAARLPGFAVGRFDLRAPSVVDFQTGQDIKVLELNGVAAEATHIYDPRVRLRDAYRVLAAQWRLLFDIGELQRQRGAQPEPLGRFLLRVRTHLRRGPVPGTRSAGPALSRVATTIALSEETCRP